MEKPPARECCQAVHASQRKQDVSCGARTLISHVQALRSARGFILKFHSGSAATYPPPPFPPAPEAPPRLSQPQRITARQELVGKARSSALPFLFTFN